MLSKVYSGHSFSHACRYIVNKQGAKVLECEGVRGHDYKLMSDDFRMQQQMRPGKEKACFHCSLSFYPGEVLSDEKMVKIAQEYLEKLGIVNTQYVITKHTDRKHLHLHIVANMVNNNGKSISDGYLGFRGKKIAQQLTQQYNLVPAVSKNIELTNFEALRKSEANKYKIYKEIMQALPHCKTFQDLEKKLQQRGIEVQYKYKGQTLEKQGISFKIGEDCFKGSKVDRQFSLGNLEKAIATNQKQLQEIKPRVAEATRPQGPSIRDTSVSMRQQNTVTKGLENVIEMLVKPEENPALPPTELLKENKRRKKRLSQRRL
ncbi:relaxase/mobilization nuclease domain-containing protein [Segetibacter aerophilus]|uniref:MobA/VirD2-like nuclease domain-containing protein n=1 Tax=Segetibacter aerophilus TaxID=670293 RepID=A0A512BGR0_9BACT|nr:relaxase/mobilization nuclease domain-containing protein [Segetibacter aerophilus]GEO11154.1 hypothetical protein SAE01_36500 [Segetibacter aerophilus]